MPVRLMFSFDDGFKTDISLAKLFEKYGFKATFFVTAGKVDKGSAWLSREDVYWLSEVHEVASHSLTHRPLTLLPWGLVVRELRDSRILLEDIIGERIIGFSYPYGLFNDNIKKHVREAGYLYARTTNAYWIGVNGFVGDPYSLRVTLPLYPLKLVGSIWDVVNKLRPTFLRAYLSMYSSDVGDLFANMIKRGYMNTFSFIKNVILILLERSRYDKKSYVVSLWGHSWEIMLDREAKLGFEDLLAFISSLKRDIEVLTIREVVERAGRVKMDEFEGAGGS